MDSSSENHLANKFFKPVAASVMGTSQSDVKLSRNCFDLSKSFHVPLAMLSNQTSAFLASLALFTNVFIANVIAQNAIVQYVFMLSKVFLLFSTKEDIFDCDFCAVSHNHFKLSEMLSSCLLALSCASIRSCTL